MKHLFLFLSCLVSPLLLGHITAHAEGLELSPKTQIKAVKQRLRPKKIALLIGISRYKHQSWSDLRYPKQDVAKMRSFLQKEGRFDEIVALIRPSQTTQQGVRQGLQWLKRRNRSPQDTILIYVSGHGTIAQSKPGKPLERYLITTNSTQNIPKTSVALAELQSLLQMLPARRKVIVLATCYIGQIKAKKSKGLVKGLTSGAKGQYNLGWVSRSMLVLSAAGYMQPAYEMEKLKGDVYTHFLLQCARQFMRQKKWVTATMAHHCATPRTYRYIQKTLGRQQTPSIESKIMGKDRLLLAGLLPSATSSPPKQTKHGWVKLQRNLYRRVSFRPRGSKGSQQTRSFQMDSNEGTLTLRLPPGSYHLRLLTPSSQWLDRYITISPGQTYDLSPAPPKPSVAKILDSLDSNTRTAINYFEQSDYAFHIEMGPDFEVGQRWQLIVKTGISGPYAGGGILFGGGGINTKIGKITKAPSEDLVRFSFYGQFGYPLKFQRLELFFNLYTEVGLWSTYENKGPSDLVFLFVYGPHLRIRWWLHEQFAIRFSIAMLFSVSPDRALENNTSSSVFPEYEWTHRAHVSFAFGIDFGFPAI